MFVRAQGLVIDDYYKICMHNIHLDVQTMHPEHELENDQKNARDPLVSIVKF